MVKHLGDGTFGRVWEVVSNISGEVYACKIIRAVSRYIKSAEIEAKILKDIKYKVEGIVKVKNYFKFHKSSQHKEQYCLVFERLGKSLFQFLELNDYKGYHLSVIQDITRQVLKCLSDLHEKANLIHTDLKPENILFESNKYMDIECWEELPLQVMDIQTSFKYFSSLFTIYLVNLLWL